MSAVLAIDEAAEFFAPSSSDALDVLLGQYRQARSNIERVADFMGSEEMLAAAAYFIEGNKERFRRYTPNAAELFSRDAAIPALNAAYWQRALSLTDVLDYMPDAKRRAWFEQIDKMATPDFEEATVRATLDSLLGQRMNFLAEMVDGIFQGLSGEHVTNRPEGFGKRMIIQGITSQFGIGDRSGLLHDLRSVIAKFMGRDQPHYGATHVDLRRFRYRPGEWHTMDGGALRVRVYKNGNGHMEVHPDIAWRLNQVLAHLHPLAIPARHRQRPARTVKREFTLMQRPIPFAVLKLLSEANYRASTHTLETGYRWGDADKHLRQEAVRVIEAIGGADVGGGNFAFDYDAGDVLGEVLASGMIPDHKSHQYYPTPRHLAQEAVQLAEIAPGHRCLEPSAGQGAIAELMPRDTVCVEASQLHCAVLEAKGFESIHFGDFLQYHPGRVFDRIVMNPPFSQGRAQAHVEHAASMLAPGGRLVAILPASHAGRDILPNLKTQWSRVYRNEFAGTSVDVVILTADREAA